MKKLMIIVLVFLSFSCSTENELEETPETTPRNVKIILTTNEPKFDEIVVSYRDFDKMEWVFGPRQFEYDTNGNSLPIIISFDDYTHEEIVGEAYRKNNFSSFIKVQIFVDDKLVLEKISVGTENSYASVNFGYEFS